MADLRYPVGLYEPEPEMTPERREAFIREIEAVPANLRAAVEGLTPEQLDTEYRPGGWTVRQVVHHIADSHMNAFTRFRLALTEDEPTIKPYDENGWATLADSQTADIDLSLRIVDALHARWVLMLESLTPEQLARQYRHPERGVVSLDENLGLYSWHGRHHVAHVTALREREGW